MPGQPLWTSEWIVCGFFAYLVVLARVRPMRGRTRGRIVLVSLVCVGLVVMLSQLRPLPSLRIAREWLPTIYLLHAYWLCGLFYRGPMRRLEDHLLAIDQWLFRQGRLSPSVSPGRRFVLSYFEVAYLMAYPLVPLSFGVFIALGRRGEADSFWTAMLLASLVCYGALPWIHTRPPRAIERVDPFGGHGLAVRRLNLSLLHHASVQVNTLPSGHAATSVAAALAVLTASVPVGLVVGIVAISIVLATVVGRYHYAIDSALGTAVGVTAWWIAFH